MGVEAKTLQGSNDKRSCSQFVLEQRMFSRSDLLVVDYLAVLVDNLPATLGPIKLLAGGQQHLNATCVLDSILGHDGAP
jgi:hypothetical protein